MGIRPWTGAEPQPSEQQLADERQPAATARRSPLAVVRLILLVAYGVAYLAWFLVYGLIIDRISVLLAVTLLLLIGHIGKPWRDWIRLPLDLALFATMWLAYEETRGAADRLGMPLQVESARNIDRVLFLGADPVVWMQRRFLRDHVGVHDVLASLVYFSHFIVPVAVIAVTWIRDRALWVRLMRRFATVLGVACATFVVLPTAPPWMAAGGSRAIPLDALPPLRRTALRGWEHIGLEGFIHVWIDGRDWANPTAAIPSLHSGFALFVVVFFWPMISRPWARRTLLLYPAMMGVALVYLAEHYVIDVLAGWAVVLLSCWAWDRIERRWKQRGDRAGIDLAAADV